MRHLYSRIRLLIIPALLAATACAGTGTTKSTGEYIDDAAISAKVKTELLANKHVEGKNIEVETYKGVVQLSGRAHSRDEATTAVSIAESVKGVKSVKNDIMVNN
jgi:osmotically-inducible protein OsmY